ncbi:hypothetical protein ACKLNO_04135 [Neisseriaceae bacterium B1]
MKKHTIALLLCASAALAACDSGTPQTAAQPASEAPTAPASAPVASSAPAASAASALSSKDGKVVINTSGEFADKSSDAAFLPADAQAADVLLLQYDESRNLTISAVAAGQAKATAADLFTSLKKALEADKSLKNVSVAELENNRLSYRYTHSGEPAANESCLVSVAEDKSITNVCAVSTDLSVDELKAVLADVKIGA